MNNWECAYCGFTHKHSKRPTKCSCRNGYVKHIKLDANVENDDE